MCLCQTGGLFDNYPSKTSLTYYVDYTIIGICVNRASAAEASILLSFPGIETAWAKAHPTFFCTAKLVWPWHPGRLPGPAFFTIPFAFGEKAATRVEGLSMGVAIIGENLSFTRREICV